MRNFTSTHLDPDVPACAVREPLITLLVEADVEDAQRIATGVESAAAASNGAPVRVVHAGSVRAACAMLRRVLVDVVMLDLSLPDAGGLESLRRIHVAQAGVPVVALAESAEEGAAIETLRAGAQDYVLKPPPDGATLRRILYSARERQRMVQELEVARRASALDATRWRLLAEAGEVLAADHDIATAIENVAHLMVPDAAECCVLYVADDERPAISVVAHVDAASTPRLRERVREFLAVPERAGDRFVALLCDAEAATGTRLAASPARPLLDLLAMTRGVAAPLRVDGRVQGFVVFGAATGRSEAAADLAFGRSLADRIGLALDGDRLLRQMQRTVAARDRAMGIVSHDLMNSLSTVQVCSAALLDREPPSVIGMRQMAQLIQRSTAWMQQIVQDLLDRASLEAGWLALEREPTAVSDIVGAAQVMFARLAEENSLTFVVESATDLPHVNADPRRLLQVLSNLLRNAMKFTSPGGRVAMSVCAVDEDAGDAVAAVPSAVRFSVDDTGTGIPPEDLAHVFDWFWHSHCGRRDGAGLGLAIAKGLIEAHHSRLCVESEVGRGSTFWFTLPTVAEEMCRMPPPRQRNIGLS